MWKPEILKYKGTTDSSCSTPCSESSTEVQNNVTFALFGVRRIPWRFGRFSGGSFFELNFISKK